MYMIFFVLHDPAHLDDVLDAWKAAGVSGATILESTGMYRQLLRHIPMRYVFEDVEVDEGSQTLISIVNSMALVETCLAAAEKVVGDLSHPHTGIFAAWPLAIAKGIDKIPLPPLGV